MVVVPVAAVMMFTGVSMAARSAMPIGECHEGGVLGWLVVHGWVEPCGGTEDAPSQSR